MAMQHRRLLLLPLALLIVGAVVLAARKRGVESHLANLANDSPEACITLMLSAEERGDPRAYLDCFSLPQREKLETLWQGQSQSQIAAELRSQSAGLVGRAMTDLTFANSDHAGFVLERISQDYVERQQFTLVRDGGRWQITELSAPERQTPAIPYGTPVCTPQ